jgi:hypothetical protein
MFEAAGLSRSPWAVFRRPFHTHVKPNDSRIAAIAEPCGWRSGQLRVLAGQASRSLIPLARSALGGRLDLGRPPPRLSDGLYARRSDPAAGPMEKTASGPAMSGRGRWPGRISAGRGRPVENRSRAGGRDRWLTSARPSHAPVTIAVQIAGGMFDLGRWDVGRLRAVLSLRCSIVAGGLERRGAGGMVCREIRVTGRGMSRWGGRDARMGSRLAGCPDLPVFPLTRECGRCPMRAEVSRARCRKTRSTLIWEISASPAGSRSGPDGLRVGAYVGRRGPRGLAPCGPRSGCGVAIGTHSLADR